MLGRGGGGGHHHHGGGGMFWGGGWGPGWWGPEVVVAQSAPACPLGQMAVWNDEIGQYNCAPVTTEGMSGLEAITSTDLGEVGGGAILGAIVGAAVGKSGNRGASALVGAGIGAAYITIMKSFGK